MKASRFVRGALLACGLLLIAACSSAHNEAPVSASAAATATAASSEANTARSAPPAKTSVAQAHFTDGNQYVTLKLPAGQAAPRGPVEVVEVFSYGCPHCAEFAPYMDKLRAELPKGVEVRYMPAVFSPAWMPYAQAFYAARELGVLKQTHDAVFRAMLEHYPLNSLSDLADFYARHGVNRDKFIAAATSAETTKQMADDQHTEMGWGIDATPTLVVGRRAGDDKDAPFIALMRSANIDSYAQLQQLGLWMVDHVEKR
ncbi:MAG TPA: thiol:disulfide interchange protein DsbA/DsbL [Rhodanobacteraceae bacterium]|nr:thiol:disulfide interchange protein DsbA/DsbL [Rhodanobacteraceae bacterium]